MKKLLNLLIISIKLSLSNSNKDVKTSELDTKNNATLTNWSSLSDDYELSTLRRYYDEVHQGINLKGRLRKGFVLEAAMQHAWNNIVCSPISALLPLGKLALGTIEPTRQELLLAIGVSSYEEISNFKKLIRDLQYLPGVVLTVATGIYVSDTVKAKLISKFIEAATDIFQSGIKTTSFANPAKAADEINAWVSHETMGEIPTIIDPDQITKTTSMIIVNAIYFKGKWKDIFRKVQIGDFYAPTGTKKTQMMSQEGKYNYVVSNVLNAQVIEIPYEASNASFIIVLPLEKFYLPVLLNQLKLHPALLNQALMMLQEKEVKLTIPKFKITSTLDLKKLYNMIGMKRIFESHSGLKQIVKNAELQISSAIQKAVIEVHETGTEASAASFVNMLGSSLFKNETTIFNANHPFLFYLIANKEPLFGGVFVDP